MTAVDGGLVAGDAVFGGLLRGFGGSLVRSTDLTDGFAPVFAGATSVDTPTLDSLVVHWAAATDDVTSQSNIVYEVAHATSAGGCTGGSFAPTVASVAGGTSVLVGGLASGTLHYFCVRARDGAGNRDTNNVTVNASTLAPDTTAPTFAGVTALDNPSLDSLTVHWAAGTDAVTAQGSLQYDVAIATSSGGCTGGNFAGAVVASSTPGATSIVVGGLASGTTYFSCVRCRDAAGNRDTNNAFASATTLAPDTTAPTFAGITALDTPTTSSLVARWSAGTDAVTAQGSLVYDVAVSTSAPGCTGSNFAGARVASSIPGATSAIIGGLSPGVTYFSCVRCRDAAGNEDANNVTQSATTTALDTAIPVVDNYVPALGTPINASDPLQFDVTDLHLRRALVVVRYPNTRGELAFDGAKFVWPFSVSSSRSGIPNGLRISLVRSGGWQDTPSPEVFAYDTSGNENA